MSSLLFGHQFVVDECMMQNIEIFQVDAFTDKVFHGNPAAICLLPDWLNDELLQAIACENNLSETAFVIENSEGFHIRWFTPNGEISLCGHATLAAGFLLFELEKCQTDSVSFSSLSGTLGVKKKGELYTLDFPKLSFQACESGELTNLVDKPVLGRYVSELDYLILLAHERDVMAVQVDLNMLVNLPKRGLIVTAKSDDADFYSRCFYPKHHVPEDPVTGSAHCVLAPFWAERLHKNRLRAIQGGFRRGEVFCNVLADSVLISGYCRWYLKGYLVI